MQWIATLTSCRTFSLHPLTHPNSIDMVGAAMLLFAASPIAMAPRASRPSRRAFVAPSAAALRVSRRVAASPRQFHSTVCAQTGLEKKIVTEGSGASPKQGDKVGGEGCWWHRGASAATSG
jgi:hypothetical protein